MESPMVPDPATWTMDPTDRRAISPVFVQDEENFVVFADREESTLTVYCCSACQWKYDESFTFDLSICTGGEQIVTSACFTRKQPFCCLSVTFFSNMITIAVNVCQGYPYTMRGRVLGIVNSGATCYIATIIQFLFHTGAFRQLIYGFKNTATAPAALQNLFVELQLGSRAPKTDAFIRSLGSFSDLALVQNDAHEFLVNLIERFESDLGDPFKLGAKKIFCGKSVRMIKGRDVDYVSRLKEEFFAIPVVVERLRSLTESLKLATATDVIKDYDADDHGRIEVEQTMKFAELPPILIFQLCRFSYNRKTRAVIELRSAFDCPFDLDMADFSCEGEPETNYELYGVTAHSGNPVFGHYTSYFRPRMSKEWVLFNDGAIKDVEKARVSRLFGSHSSSKPSFFKAFSFTSAIAYMVYYVRKDCHHYVDAGESIPLHLVPHRSNSFFSRFVFTNNLVGQPLNFDFPPFEWKDASLSFDQVLALCHPEVPITGVAIWVRMPGQSTLIGPIPLHVVASTYVIKGHSTTFFVAPTSIRTTPVFLATEKPPRTCLEFTELKEVSVPDGYEARYQFRSLDSSPPIHPGSLILARPTNSTVLKFGHLRFTFPKEATYGDVQKRLSLWFGKSPNVILILHNKEPMLPASFPYITTFPTKDLSYQFLDGDVTVCSVELFIQLSVVYVSTLAAKQRQEPFWLRRGSTCTDLVNLFEKIFPHMRVANQSDTARLQVSIGKIYGIDRILTPKSVPPREQIRFDTVLGEVPTTRRLLRKIVKNEREMTIEVRFTRSIEHLSFEGTSRMISIDKQTKYLDLRCNMMRISGGASDRPGESILFVSEKPKIRLPLTDEDNLYEAIKKMIPKMTKNDQRLAVALVAESSLIMTNNPVKTLTKSLSGLLNRNPRQAAKIE